jgi:hypothetical protein
VSLTCRSRPEHEHPQISDQQSPVRNLEHRSADILIDVVTHTIDKDIFKTMFQIAYRRSLIALNQTVV